MDVSINAIVESVTIGPHEITDDQGRVVEYDFANIYCALHLTGEERGQPVLLAAEPLPMDLSELKGCRIWGGACDIMYGETRIAKRIGYNRIEFVVNSIRDVITGSRVQLGLS